MTGTYEHSVDAKGRMNFPAKLREECGEHFYITKSTNQKCLTVYNQEGWDALREKLKLQPQSQAAKLERYIFGGACEAEPDKQGRIAISALLRTFADITVDAVVVGVGDHAEIWNKQHWEEYNDSISFEEISELAAELRL